MKKLFRFAALLVSFAAVVLTSCKPGQPEQITKDPFENAKLTVKLVGTDKTSATISLDAEVLKVVSYVVEPTESKGEYTATEIFAKENLVVLESEGATQVTFNNLTPDTSYTVQIAGRISSDKVWETVKSFEFTTEMRDPVLTANAVASSITATAASFEVTTDNISRIAYIVEKFEANANTPKVPVIFATGTVVKVANGTTTIDLQQLSPNTEYVVYIAGEIAGREEFFENVVVVDDIKTTDFTDQIRIYDVGYRGFKVDLKVDPKIKQQDHVIKYGYTDLVMWANSYFGGLMNNATGGQSCGASINLNDKAYHNYVQESTTFDFSDPNYEYMFDPMVPGQPEVVMFGEFRFGDIEEFMGWTFGGTEGLGYYIPLFSWNSFNEAWARRKNQWEVINEADYWTGFFHKEIVVTQQPDELPQDSFNIDCSTSPKDAVISFQVTNPEVEMIALMILEEDNYQTLMHYLLDNPDYLQWFTTSYTAMFAVSSYTFDPWHDRNGNPTDGFAQVKLSEYFYELRRNYNYRVFAVGLGGDYNNDGVIDGNKQCYKHFEFKLPEATKEAPEMIITPMDELATTDKVVFNIKCPTKDLIDVVFAANTRKEFERGGYTIDEIMDMVEGYQENHFSGPMINMVNSDNGYNLEISAAPGEEIGCVVMGINDEGSKGISKLVYSTAKDIEAPERVEHEYFESLKGTWTATARVLTAEPEGEDNVKHVIVERSCEVVIGDIEYPETLSQDVYDLYEQAVGADKETTDGYYAEFTAAADKFNEKTRAFNRILMNGFNFEASDVPFFNYSSAFDLFCSSTYNGASSVSPIIDFGPKWFLEIDAEGNVTAPFNAMTFDPMASWYYDTQSLYESYLMGYYFDPEDYNVENIMIVGSFGEDYQNGHFPVEVSEDGNTITVKPLMYSYNDGTGNIVTIPFYPSSCINYGSGQFDPLEICSEIVLTRNTATAAPKKAQRKDNLRTDHTKVRSNIEVSGASKVMSRTSIQNLKPVYEVKIDKTLSNEERAQHWFDVRRK